MRLLQLTCVACLCAIVAGHEELGAQQGRNSTPVLFEGALLIGGSGNEPIEDSAFLVEDGHFTRVGRRGAIRLPAGGVRVALSGKTVIPGLIDGHSHIGYMKGLSSGAANYTRENILDHLYRFAYAGVVATQAMGTDFGELPFRIRDDVRAGKYPDAARFLTAGRGLSPLSEISPDNMRQAAFPITTPEGARASVEELAQRQVTLVKTWVDDRGGAVEMLPPALYTAIIDEAHHHDIRVAVHATDPKVAKDLLRAGIDVFAHMISDVDDELVELFRQHPSVAVLSALGGPHRAVYAPWLKPVHPLILETVLPDQISRLQGRFPQRDPSQRQRSEDAWAKLAGGIVRLKQAGVTIGVGTDGGGQQGDQFLGWTMHAELENLVMAGMSPAEALAAATRVTAGILRQDDLGTVAPGKSADFVVLDANPLVDITNTRRIADVFIRGRAIDRNALRARFMAGTPER